MPEPITEFRGRYRFLSNFYPYDGEDPSRTLEHFYQAAKCELLDDARWVLEAGSPGEAKKRGRMVALRADWDLIKDNVMRALVVSKFLGSAELSRLLLETGDADLVEGNTWHDNYWGRCVCETCRRRGVGENRLGMFLMETRRWVVYYAQEYARRSLPREEQPTSGEVPVVTD